MGKMYDNLRAMADGKTPLPPIQQALGFEIVELQEGSVKLSCYVDSRFHNPMGMVHGGTLAELTDAAMGIAFATLLEIEETEVTIELKTNFTRPVREAMLEITGTVTYKGKTIGLCESEVRNEKNKLIAKSTATFFVIRGDEVKGSEIDFHRQK